MAHTIIDVKIKDVMSSRVVTIPPSERVDQALDLMINNCFRHLFVVHENRLVGIITLADILSLQASNATQRLTFGDMLIDLEHDIVASTMTTIPITVGELDSIERALLLMSQHRCSGLPVMDTNGAICGLITESDIVQLIASHWRPAAD